MVISVLGRLATWRVGSSKHSKTRLIVKPEHQAMQCRQLLAIKLWPAHSYDERVTRGIFTTEKMADYQRRNPATVENTKYTESDYC